MRIFLTLAVNAASGYNDQTYRYIFYDTLVALGHDVVFLPYHETLAEKGTAATATENIWNRFASDHREKPFDIFFSYYHGNQVLPELFRRVREIVPCINYTTNFHQIALYEPLLKESTFSVFVSKEAEAFFSANGYPGYYLPFAGLRKNLVWNERKNGLIAFSGTSYGPRAQYIWRCLQAGLPLHVYGANWRDDHRKRAALRTLRLEADILSGNPRMADTAYRCLNDIVLRDINRRFPERIHDPLPDDEYSRLLSESSIVLNFPESRYGHDFSDHRVLVGANLRDFEVPCAGSLLFTQDNEEIRSMFEEGNEIVTFGNERELAEKARFYLANPDLIVKTARAGHERILREHLWEHRFTQLLDHIEKNII